MSRRRKWIIILVVLAILLACCLAVCGPRRLGVRVDAWDLKANDVLVVEVTTGTATLHTSIAVEESDTQVTVRAYIWEIVGVPRTLVGVRERVTVQLGAPLGNRTVVDGHSGDKPMRGIR